jgi:hypothetical protein
VTDDTTAAGDRAEIAEVVSRHGHLIDAGRLDELDSVFTPTSSSTSLPRLRCDGVRLGGRYICGS